MRTLAVALCAVALTGCLDASVIARIEADGSGTVTMEMVFSEDFMRSMEQLSGEFGGELEGGFGDPGDFDVDASLEDLEQSIPPDLRGRVRIEVFDGGRGMRIEFDFADPDELVDMLSEVDGEGQPTMTDVEIDVTDDAVSFSATVADQEALGGPGSDMMELFGITDLPEPTFTFALELPGSVKDGNADEVDGNTARWDMFAAAGKRIHATSGVTSDLFGIPLRTVAIGGGVLAFLVLLIALVKLRKRSRTPATTTTPIGVPQPAWEGAPAGLSSWGPAAGSLPATGAPGVPGVPAPTPGASPGGWGPTPGPPTTGPAIGVPTGPQLAGTPPVAPPVAPVPTAPVPTSPPAPGTVPDSPVPTAPSLPSWGSTPASPPPTPGPAVVAPTPQLPPLGEAPRMPEVPTPAQPASWAPLDPVSVPQPTQVMPQVMPQAPEPQLPPQPPAPPPAGPPAAWYPDPAGSGRQRWWNGEAWTDDLA